MDSLTVSSPSHRPSHPRAGSPPLLLLACAAILLALLSSLSSVCFRSSPAHDKIGTQMGPDEVKGASKNHGLLSLSLPSLALSFFCCCWGFLRVDGSQISLANQHAGGHRWRLRFGGEDDDRFKISLSLWRCLGWTFFAGLWCHNPFPGKMDTRHVHRLIDACVVVSITLDAPLAAEDAGQASQGPFDAVYTNFAILHTITVRWSSDHVVTPDARFERLFNRLPPFERRLHVRPSRRAKIYSLFIRARPFRRVIPVCYAATQPSFSPRRPARNLPRDRFVCLFYDVSSSGCLSLTRPYAPLVGVDAYGQSRLVRGPEHCSSLLLPEWCEGPRSCASG